VHIIICGRAGYEYDMELNEETGRKELVKTGIKMKTEGEFGFEPSLLVEMEREQLPDGKGGFRLQRRGTVLGDRFGVIDGATTLDPTFDFFTPHLALLKPGAHAPIDTAVKSDVGVDDEGNDGWSRERKTRTILCEEIQGELVNAPDDGRQEGEGRSHPQGVRDQVLDDRGVYSERALSARLKDFRRYQIVDVRAQQRGFAKVEQYRARV
jgi:hypothetical protein